MSIGEVSLTRCVPGCVLCVLNNRYQTSENIKYFHPTSAKSPDRSKTLEHVVKELFVKYFWDTRKYLSLLILFRWILISMANIILIYFEEGLRNIFEKLEPS